MTQPGRRRPLVRRREDVLEVIVGTRTGETVRAALERWYRARAREEIGKRLDEATARAGTSYGRLAIRDQRTRWASCSSSGTMSFNWRLMLAPEDVLEYVVEHEVAHLEVPDHSPRFWRLLGRRLPTYRESRQWLRRHGASLRFS
jgi:predicted metal-dependent hydrolase